jgi:7,8-dihydropterin-6-yl-methyl-4-(beta-D-ribofuranosyl)aminobenzene 5'-phosphate synthase
VVRHAQRVTGIDRVHAFVGGMHLTGGANEATIARTVEELVAIGSEVVVAGHCTGTKAIHALANTLPQAYVPSNVGTTYHFRAG